MLLAFVSLIALSNGILGYIGNLFGYGELSIQAILGFIFAPVMYFLNVPWAEAQQAGAIFGEKVVLNEFIAYISLVGAEGDFSERTVVILTFALCGFANLSSIAILLGGLGALIPDRMNDIAKMGVKAVFAASLANLMSAALAGILVGM
jgi:CNT family concentrative nucleoside transporter